MNPVLITPCRSRNSGALGVVAMSLAAASKVEPPSLIKDKNMTMNRNEAEDTSEDDEN